MAMNTVTVRKSFINITLTDQKGEEQTIRINRNLHLSKMMRAYCERKRLDYRAMVFIYDGYRINHKQTPNIMKDYAGVTVFRHNNGGGGCIGGPVMVIYG